MAKKKRTEMTKLKELQARNRVLDTVFHTWFYGLSKAGGEAKDPDVVGMIREIQADAVRHWIYDMLGQKVPKSRDAMAACEWYVNLLHKQGLMRRESFKMTEKDGNVTCTVKAPCMYKEICSELVDEGVEPLCFRTQPFITVIEEANGKKYIDRPTLVRPQSKCVIELAKK